VEDHHRHVGAAEGVALDIGSGVGALVVHATRGRLGREVEVSPLGSPERRVHAEVHQRRAGGDALYAAVIDGLAEGEYQVWTGAPAPAGRVRIDGGAVTEIQWNGWPRGRRT
jgi:hypothetical protein